MRDPAHHIVIATLLLHKPKPPRCLIALSQFPASPPASTAERMPQAARSGAQPRVGALLPIRQSFWPGEGEGRGEMGGGRKRGGGGGWPGPGILPDQQRKTHAHTTNTRSCVRACSNRSAVETWPNPPPRFPTSSHHITVAPAFLKECATILCFQIGLVDLARFSASSKSTIDAGRICCWNGG